MDSGNPQQMTAELDAGDRTSAGLAQMFADEPELIRACLQDIERVNATTIETILAAVRAGVRRHPDYADLLYHAGQAAMAAGRYEAAASLLGQAIEINPRYKDALILAARVAVRFGDWEQAQARLDAALAAGADYPDVHLLRGELWRRKGSEAQARAAYERALELNPNLAAAREALTRLPAVGDERGGS